MTAFEKQTTSSTTNAFNKQIKSGFTFINQRVDSESSQPLTVISLTRAVEEDSTSHSHEPMSQSALEKLQATHLTTLAVVRFPKTIGKLQVNSDFFKTAAPDYQFTLFAKHAASATEAVQSKPKREQATLSATQTTAHFFDKEKWTGLCKAPEFIIEGSFISIGRLN